MCPSWEGLGANGTAQDPSAWQSAGSPCWHPLATGPLWPWIRPVHGLVGASASSSPLTGGSGDCERQACRSHQSSPSASGFQQKRCSPGWSVGWPAAGRHSIRISNLKYTGRSRRPTGHDPGPGAHSLARPWRADGGRPAELRLDAMAAGTWPPAVS